MIAEPVAADCIEHFIFESSSSRQKQVHFLVLVMHEYFITQATILGLVEP